MQSLLAASFISPTTIRAAPCPKQFLLKHNSFFACKSKALAPAKDGLKRSRALLQDGAAIQEPVPLLTEETMATTVDVAVEEGPKVNVKFVLQKECHFGERFNVVGNDPLLGNWDVEAAIPMVWEDGNIWSVELDVPVEKQVEFKFVLTGQDGDIEWQPGSNRMFKTVEGVSPLVVAEAWESLDEAAIVEAPEELSEPSTTTSNTDGLLVPADILGVEEAAKEEVDELNGQPKPSEPQYEMVLEVPSAEMVLEVPSAEMEKAATTVEARPY